MSNVLLFYPRTKEIEFEDIEVPYSILFPGSYLSQNGIPVKLFDGRTDIPGDALKYVKEKDVDIVGISSMSGPPIKYAIEFSKQIKRLDKEITVIWGGIHPTLDAESVLEKDYVDLVVRGEGEETLLECIESIRSKRDLSRIKNISFKHNKRIKHTDARPFIDINGLVLDWQLLDRKRYIHEQGNRRHIAFITSRGCPFRCSYCYNPIVNKRRWRAWSLDKTIEELDKVLQDGVNYIYFFDDCIEVNKNRIFGICEYLKQKDVYWRADMRMEFINEKTVKRLHNCENILFGAESGSPRMLKLLNKDATVDTILNTVTVLKHTSIRANYSWMMGLPGEQKEDLKQTLDLMDRIHTFLPNAEQMIKLYTPYPGGELYHKAVEYGFTPPQKLEDWAAFERQDCVLDYITNPWYYKCISYVSFFYLYVGRIIAPKKIYRPIIYIYRRISKLRWKWKFFKLPFEFMLLEMARKMLR